MYNFVYFKKGENMKERDTNPEHLISYAHDLIPPSENGIRFNSITDSYQAIYILSGNGKCVVEGAEFKTCPGVILLIRPMSYYYIEILPECPYEAYKFSFDRSVLLGDSTFYIDRMMTENNHGKYFPPTSQPFGLLSVCEKFEASELLRGHERGLFLSLLISEAVVLMSSRAGEKLVTTDFDIGAEIIEFLDCNFHKDISLDQISKHFFVSKFHLCRSFKRRNGISIHSYISNKRVMLARELIRSGEPAQSAAFKVGFADYSAFYRAYVKFLGNSPAQEVVNNGV